MQRLSQALFPFFKNSLQKKCISLLATRKDNFDEIRSHLIDNSHNLKSSAIVKLAHYVQFSPQNTKQLTKIEKNHIFQKIGSDIVRFEHESLILFLEILHNENLQYSKNSFLFRQISRRMFSVHTIQLDNKLKYRLLYLLLEIKFPPILIYKYINVLLMREKKTKTNQPIPNIDVLRINIAMLELKYIPFYMFKKFWEMTIPKYTFTQPKQLCLLYYLLKYCEANLVRKTNYFEQKEKIHDLLFNPFADLEKYTEEHEKDMKSKQQKDQSSEEMKKKQKKQMNEQVQQFIKQLSQKNDKKKLQKQIQRIYIFQQFPITPTSAVLLYEISTMWEILAKYCQDNYKQLTINQFLILSKTILPLETRQTFLTKYSQEMNEFLSLPQKLKILKFEHQFGKGHHITKDSLIDLLKDKNSINSQQFIDLCQIIKQFLNQKEQGEIIKLVQELINKQN